MREITTITIERSTRDRLADLGSKDSTFDAIIQKLLKKWQENEIDYVPF